MSKNGIELHVTDSLGQGKNCGYCGKARNLNIVELVCDVCQQFHHESCISYQLGKLVPFLINYNFCCRNCSATGLETFKKLPAQTFQMCVTALANLQQNSMRETCQDCEGVKPNSTESSGQLTTLSRANCLFSFHNQIVPWVETHWESLTTVSRRATHSWKITFQKMLSKDSTFVRQDMDADGVHTSKHPLFGLRNSDLTQIRPSFEAANHRHKHMDNAKVRGAKRKLHELSLSAKRSRAECNTVKSHGYPLDHPFNKDGFRYILTEPDTNAPFRQKFDECSDSNTRTIPGWLYRAKCSSVVLWALNDRAPCLRVSDDRLSVTGDKGYCAARATHAVTQGTWYYELTFTAQPLGSHVRIGWAQSVANLNAPLGYDRFGYSWRSRSGTAFHAAHGHHFSEGYAEGDVLGLLIHLPEDRGRPLLTECYKNMPLIKWKSHLYYEYKEDATAMAANLKPLNDSYIACYKNGEYVGKAFSDIYKGSYYPCISLYKNSCLTANFGPNFKHFSPNLSARPMSDRVQELIVESTLADTAWLAEHEGQLSIET